MRSSICSLLLTVLILAPAVAFGSQAQAEALFKRGGLDNLKQAAWLYQQAAASAPDDYELHWKAARALREFWKPKRLGWMR